MKRLARLVRVLDRYPADPDVDGIARELGVSPTTVRRDLRDLREAGATLPAPRATDAEHGG